MKNRSGIKYLRSDMTLGNLGERFDEEGIDKQKGHNQDHRAQIQSARFVRRDVFADGTQKRLGQLVKKNIQLVKGWNLNPGQNSSDDDDPYVNGEKEVNNLGNGEYKISPEHPLI
jgi:hypothetical protein